MRPDDCLAARGEYIMEKHEIRALYTKETVRVYQAYNKQIAEEAVRLNHFGESFNLNRMTWIKPSFLWMMYRSGWGEKENQEHILAIDITREGFEEALHKAVLSSYDARAGISKEDWQMQIKTSDVRVQWDPEKDVNGNNLPYRSLQLGLRGKALQEYVNSWIVNISDISDYVRELNGLRKTNQRISELLPKERVYTVSDNIAIIPMDS